MSGRIRNLVSVRRLGVCLLALAVALPLMLAAATDRQDDIDRVDSAARVFQQVMAVPDKAIPDRILKGADCIVIIPGEKQFALGIGGIYGKGVASCRNHGTWSAPFFVTLAGGSWGAQIGGESSDIVMVFRHRSGLDGMLNTKVRIGAGASAAGGPIGRDVDAATDADLAGILTYARSRGVFAGIDLNGALLKPDDSANMRMYGAEAHKKDVLSGEVTAPTWSRRLLNALEAR